QWGGDGCAAGGAGRGRVGHGHGDRALGAGGGSEPGQLASERPAPAGMYTLSLHDALPIFRDGPEHGVLAGGGVHADCELRRRDDGERDGEDRKGVVEGERDGERGGAGDEPDGDGGGDERPGGGEGEGRGGGDGGGEDGGVREG